MGLFIDVEVDPALAHDRASAAKLAEVCPVDIFAQDAQGALAIVEAQVDECTLCELCLAVGAAGQVRVLKRYDGGKPLARSAPLHAEQAARAQRIP